MKKLIGIFFVMVLMTMPGFANALGKMKVSNLNTMGSTSIVDDSQLSRFAIAEMRAVKKDNFSTSSFYSVIENKFEKKSEFFIFLLLLIALSGFFLWTTAMLLIV